MPDSHAILAGHLDDLVAELQRLELWAEQPPTPEAMASTAPFCYDSMAFEQWLQWVFIPQLRQMIALQAPLPGECSIAPMAELAFEKNGWDSTVLIDILEAIDSSFTLADGHTQ